MMSGFAEQLAEQATWSSKTRHIEADLRSDLARVLIPYAISEAGIAPELIRQEGTGTAGRFDSMFGSAIVEYKRPGLLDVPRERENAAKQAIGYLDDGRLRARVVIVTDGSTWGFLRDSAADASLASTQIPFDFGLDVPIPATSRFSWRPTSVATATAVLDLLASQRAAPVTASTLIATLGPSATEALQMITSLAGALTARHPYERTDTLFRQWILTAGIPYGIERADQPWPDRPNREGLLGAVLSSVFASHTYAETIFCLHTYIAIVTKLVAAEVLALQSQKSHFRPTNWPFLEDERLYDRLDELETGIISDQLAAPGLLSADLFEWYASEARHNPDLTRSIRRLISQLNLLSWAQVATAGGLQIDLLRDLYQATVPRGLRKALGEFFTPRWLAEYVLTEALKDLARPEGPIYPVPRTLDPACGSGTFLVTTLRAGLARLDLQGEGEDPSRIQDLIDRIFGVDINPVSALMSRVNLLLALGDRASLLPDVTFHVFHADSIVLPRVRVGQGTFGDSGTDLVIPTAVGDFHLHPSLMSPSRMAMLREAVETALRARLSRELFETNVAAELRRMGSPSDEVSQAVASAARLFVELAALRDQGRDDVWARVLEQFVAPHFLSDFELVIGNPPWISWKDLPNPWKQRSEPVWRSWGLWKTRQAGSGVPLADISSLMVARSLTSYTRNGLVAMLLPKSVILADPGGNAFRRSHLRPDPQDFYGDGSDSGTHFRVVAMDDFASVNPFAPDASNQTVALFIRPGLTPIFPFPARVWNRLPGARIRAEDEWRIARLKLEVKAAKAAPVDPTSVESPWGIVAEAGSMQLKELTKTSAGYRFGRGFETRGLDGLFLYEILSDRPVGGIVRVRNLPGEGKNTRNESPREGSVECARLYPWLKGEDVQRWTVAKASRYVFLPYEVSDGVSVVPITTAECASRYPRLFRYLQPWLDRFERRSLYHKEGTPEFPWALSGPVERLVNNGFLVLVRYLATNGRPAAAVTLPYVDHRIGRDVLPVPNNKSNILYVRSEEEAHFVAAFINSEPAQKALGRFAASTGVTPVALARLPLPIFDGSASHMELARLGAEATLAAYRGDDLTPIEAAINRLALSLTA